MQIFICFHIKCPEVLDYFEPRIRVLRIPVAIQVSPIRDSIERHGKNSRFTINRLFCHTANLIFLTKVLIIFAVFYWPCEIRHYEPTCSPKIAHKNKSSGQEIQK